MSPNESLEFFKAQLARSAQGLEVARVSKNLQLAALNGRQMFKACLMCGLIKWRQGDSPVDFFQKGVGLLVESSNLIASWQPSFVLAENLPIARGALLADLLGVTLDVPVVTRSLEAQDQLDYALATSVAGAAAAVPSIDKLKSGKKTELAAETYQTYFEILSRAGSREALRTLVERAETLFTRRASDAFFSGGEQTEGGGPDNALVVDYRLGVVLKKAGYRADSIHAWHW